MSTNKQNLQPHKLQTLRGFRDFLPQEKRKRDYVQQKVVEVFERFGFDPLQTPYLEYAEVILGKYGDEADKLVYTFKDKGGRKVALPYDQTVPTARVLAQYQSQLPKYFRRYQIQSVFRADKPQAGRYREFTQCDIDIFGSSSPLADAEILACTYFAFKNVGYPTVYLKVNDRQILFNALEQYKTDNVRVLSIIQSVDKLDKKPEQEVIQELVNKGLIKANAQKCLQDIKSAELSENLAAIIKASENLGIPSTAIKFAPTLARGLDYYTGMIFEVAIPEYPTSLGGGGRYDKLIGQLGEVDIPAVGIAFGFDRMVLTADKLKLIPTGNIGTTVLVAIFDSETQAQSLLIAGKLRQAGIKTEVYPATDKLDKQLKYADKKGIPFVAIIGEDEAKNNTVTLKDMRSGNQQTIQSSKLIQLLADENR